jgi:hypothetical protein
MDTLPDEILKEILDYLDLEEKLEKRIVSKRFEELIPKIFSNPEERLLVYELKTKIGILEIFSQPLFEYLYENNDLIIEKLDDNMKKLLTLKLSNGKIKTIKGNKKLVNNVSKIYNSNLIEIEKILDILVFLMKTQKDSLINVETLEQYDNYVYGFEHSINSEVFQLLQEKERELFRKTDEIQQQYINQLKNYIPSYILNSPELLEQYIYLLSLHI